MAHRKTRGVYDKALTYEKIYAAWNTVSHTCKNKQGLYEFALFAQARVAKILEELQLRKYWPNKYRCFMIFEPKPRLVMSQSIRDKVVNHFVAREYLLPLLERTLADANVATRKGKGSSYAMKMLKKYFAQMMAERPGEKIYALKIDVSKYFYTIGHEILFKMLRKRIKDKDVLEILRRIVGETNKPYINKVVDGFNKCYGVAIPYYEKGKGLSIGAKLRELKLEVNPKSAIYDCMTEAGFAFLGYRYYVDVDKGLRVVCLAETVRRVRRRLSVLTRHNREKYKRSYESYKGYFMNALPRREMKEMVRVSLNGVRSGGGRRI